MSQYFNTFETQADFDAAEIGCPSVSLVKEDNVIYYCENTCDGKTSYFDLSNQSDLDVILATIFAKSVKWIMTGGDYSGSTFIVPPLVELSEVDAPKCLAVAVELDQLILYPEAGVTTLIPMSKDEEFSALFSSLPEITKEEFYKLPAALMIYTYYKDQQAHQDEMKTTFDALWAIWERDGVEGQELAITLPNADIASMVSNTEGSLYHWESFTIHGYIYNYSDNSVKVTQIEIDAQSYGPILRKLENLTTGEVFYEYEFLA